MKKRKAILCAVIPVLIVLGLCLRTPPPPVVFQGKTIAEWSQMLVSSDMKAREAARTCITEMGTDAVPPLIDQLRAREWGIKVWWRKLVVRLRPSAAQVIAPNFKKAEAANQRANAALALKLLGQKAAPAVPALGEVLRDPDGSASFESAAAPSLIGVDSLTILTNALTDARPFVRRNAAMALGGMGAKASPALQVLRRLCLDEVANVRIAATNALGSVAADPSPL